MKIEKICVLSNGTLKEEYNVPNVIRCEDCKYWAYDNFNDEGEISDSWCSRDGANFMSMSADDFCSRGEKK